MLYSITSVYHAQELQILFLFDPLYKFHTYRNTFDDVPICFYFPSFIYIYIYGMLVYLSLFFFCFSFKLREVTFERDGNNS